MGNSRSKRSGSKSRSSSSSSSSSFSSGSRSTRGGHYLAFPSSLYDASSWDRKDLSRMVLGGEIAPLIPGSDDELLDLRIPLECPICFLYYAECAVNVTACCSKPICSECYLSINGTTDVSSSRPKQKQKQTKQLKKQHK